MIRAEWQKCMDVCRGCAAECERCTDACLDDKDVSAMATCIRMSRDCMAACMFAVHLMASGSRFAEQFCRLCAEICNECAVECRKHNNEQCRRCADVCMRCADECRKMAGVRAA